MTVKTNGGLNQMRTGVRILFVVSLVFLAYLSFISSSIFGDPFAVSFIVVISHEPSKF